MLNNIFALSFPENWKETTVYTFEGPFDSGVQHNLIFAVDRSVDKKTELKSYVSGQLQNVRQAMPGFEMIRETELTISGSPAVVIVYKYIVSDNISLFQKQHYIHKQNFLFIFTSTYTEKTLKTIGPQIDRIVESLVVFDEKQIFELLE